MDEMELVRKAKSGDTAAFEILVRQYWAKAYRLAESIVGRTDAEDVTVEAFVQAWQSLPKFREQSSFGTWLFRIVINQAKQWQRKTPYVRFEAIEELESEREDELFSLRDIESMACERARSLCLLAPIASPSSRRGRGLLSLLLSCGVDGWCNGWIVGSN